MQHAEYHVQLVHKFVRLHPQGVGVVCHAAQALRQAADPSILSRKVAMAPVTLPLTITGTVLVSSSLPFEADLPIAAAFAAGQHLRQMQLRRPMLAGGFQQQVFHRPALAQQALGFVIDDGDAGFIIDRDHAFFNRLQHGVALFEQVGDFVRLRNPA